MVNPSEPSRESNVTNDKSLNEKQEGLYQVFSQELINAGFQATTYTRESENSLGVDVVMGKWKHRFLLLAEPNIKSRRLNSGALYYHLPEFDPADWSCVVVMYEPAWVAGATWEESNGNKLKTDYRRICYVKDMMGWDKPGIYVEIPWKLTEANLLRFFMGITLK
jgi:hypothetical protein